VDIQWKVVFLWEAFVRFDNTHPRTEKIWSLVEKEKDSNIPVVVH